MDEFTLSFAACAAAVLMLALSGAASPAFALALLAVSQAGYFIFLQLKKASVASPWAALLLLASSFVCYFVSAILFSTTGSLLALAFVPLLFCLPSIAAVARELFISG
ncbi:MAG: hypothetical protein WC717_04780 [Candidatus Micrarchaeia archaeon]|jgi:hypothetical protein